MLLKLRSIYPPGRAQDVKLSMLTPTETHPGGGSAKRPRCKKKPKRGGGETLQE